MTKKILWIAGKKNYEEINNLIKPRGNVELASVLVNLEKYPWWEGGSIPVPVYTFSWLLSGHGKAQKEVEFIEEYEIALSNIFSDSRSFYLIERLFRSELGGSVFNSSIKIEKIVWNSLAILRRHGIDRVISGETPHGIQWFLAKTAEAVGVDVLRIHRSPLPTRKWVSRGIEGVHPILPVISNRIQADSEVDMKLVRDYVAKLRSTYEDAIPSYEKRRQETYKGKFFSWPIEIRSVVKNRGLRGYKICRSVFEILRKKRELSSYVSLSSSYSNKKKQLVFFLHYQPERTTLPEGGRYVQQWLIIRALSIALPLGWQLVVREHPSTFRYVYDSSTRPQGFYEEISALPNTVLAPLELSPFQLMEESTAIATVTGTVGVEAIIRGTPVLCFGNASYVDMPGVSAVANAVEAREILKKLDDGVLQMPTDAEVEAYFEWVLERCPSANGVQSQTHSCIREALNVP